jgi:hypothetical protein
MHISRPFAANTWPAVVGPATRAAETGCEQRIALRDHIVDIRRLALLRRLLWRERRNGC